MAIEIKTERVESSAIKINALVDGKNAGRVYIYFIKNDLHEKPYAYIEDLFVEEEFRGKGISKPIMDKIKEIAIENNCYKIVGTSRFTNEFVHEYYEKIGYEKHGYSFRMNL